MSNTINIAEFCRPLILLVDDVPANLHLLTAILKDDYRIKIATNGSDALALTKLEDRPQLILLDMMMPGMNGIEVMSQLRTEVSTADIPVIVISADSSEQFQIEALELGADDYLVKPVIRRVVRARVRNLLLRRSAEAQLRLTSYIFEHSGEATIIADRNQLIVAVNPAFTQLTGYSLEEVRGRTPSLLSTGNTSIEIHQEMLRDLKEHGTWTGEIWDRHKDGNIHPKLMTISAMRNLRGEVDYYIGNFIDISERKAAEERIQQLAHHDPLTSLPNRLHFMIGMEQALAHAQRENEELAVMFIDLDHFKVINETLGHYVGDNLLVEVANRLQSCVRETDLLARLGGDEFVLTIRGKQIVRGATQIAKKILKALSRPYQLLEHGLHTSTSIGISISPSDGQNIETLMKHADTAMYHAKSRGRNNFQFFRTEMNQAATERLQMENSLYTALQEQQFILYYQPQFNAQTTRMMGVEALIRWNHPERGIIAPGQFIATAEDTGLIIPIGEWVLNSACAQLHQWQTQGLQLRVAVNISPYQFRAPHLAEFIADLLRYYKITHGLELEITESAAIQDQTQTIKILEYLHAQGVELAIDDFGTGYSSMSYLKLMPIQRLKIDRYFVRDLEHDENDAAICTAIIALAHALNLEVVAEGVETLHQRDFLKKLGCDLMQGFLFSQPLPVSQLDLRSCLATS